MFGKIKQSMEIERALVLLTEEGYCPAVTKAFNDLPFAEKSFYRDKLRELQSSDNLNAYGIGVVITMNVLHKLSGDNLAMAKGNIGQWWSERKISDELYEYCRSQASGI